MNGEYSLQSLYLVRPTVSAAGQVPALCLDHHHQDQDDHHHDEEGNHMYEDDDEGDIIK